MQNLKVTLIQTELIWEDVESNLSMFDALIDNIQDDTHLIVLPEMFTTGFTMNAAGFAQNMDGSSVKWLRDKSRQKNADIVGSIIADDKGNFFNRLIWAKPEGDMFTYDKRHLFRMAGEEKVYSAGDKNIIIELFGWKIRPFVCYDLRFPVWTRNIDKQYDAAIFVANWPAARVSAWDALLKARAIENLSYTIGVNRVGEDGNQIMYNGHSAVYDTKGDSVCFIEDREDIQTISISYNDLNAYREKFPAHFDSDSFDIK